jgi:hypothetical protein
MKTMHFPVRKMKIFIFVRIEFQDPKTAYPISAFRAESNDTCLSSVSHFVQK